MKEHGQERMRGRSRGHQPGPHPGSSDIWDTGGKALVHLTERLGLHFGVGPCQKMCVHVCEHVCAYA